MEAFFAELDELQDAYMRQDSTDEAWAPILNDLLRSIDARLLLYKRVAWSEKATLAWQMRADISGNIKEGVFPDMREAVVDAAILEKALNEAATSSRS